MSSTKSFSLISSAKRVRIFWGTRRELPGHNSTGKAVGSNPMSSTIPSRKNSGFKKPAARQTLPLREASADT